MNDLAARIESGRSERSNVDEVEDGVGDGPRSGQSALRSSLDRVDVKNPNSIMSACSNARCAALCSMGSERKQLMYRTASSYSIVFVLVLSDTSSTIDRAPSPLGDPLDGKMGTVRCSCFSCTGFFFGKEAFRGDFLAGGLGEVLR